MSRLVAVLLGATFVAASFGREPTFEEHGAIQDSLHRMPLRMQSRWLAKHGIELPGVKWGLNGDATNFQSHPT